MKFAIYIAKRYLFSKKTHNLINIISAISVVAVIVASMALFIVLSAFNGLEDLVDKLYSSFQADIVIKAAKGKNFDEHDFPFEKLKENKDINFINKTIEETVLLKYADKQAICIMKGVEKNFFNMSKIDSMIVEGYINTDEGKFKGAIIGYLLKNKLSLILNSATPLVIYTPKRSNSPIITVDNAFAKGPIYVTGVFSINHDFDDKYVLLPLEFTKKLLHTPHKITAVELSINSNVNLNKVKKYLKKILGNKFKVSTRYELNEIIYKTNRTEKFITFLILVFILVIATFNLVGALSMLILDKRKDIKTLRALGADNTLIRKIFFVEGIMINMLGGLTGLFIGAILCILQNKIGLIRLEGGIVDYYPVKMEFNDFLLILLTVFFTGIFSSWYPVKILISDSSIDNYAKTL